MGLIYQCPLSRKLSFDTCVWAGVNRGLEGLAAAVVKLWEKSEIAKIAVKRGVQNTNHERMAEQLKVVNMSYYGIFSNFIVRSHLLSHMILLLIKGALSGMKCTVGY
jgi:hypothetical protein